MIRRIRSLLTLLLLAAVAAGWWARDDLAAWWHSQGQPLLVIGKLAPQPQPERYEVIKEDAERWRRHLAGQYQAAASAAERDAVLDDARRFLEHALPDLMRCWLGTPWDFHGTAETPGDGKIACGYFVATVLRDAGFRVDRYRLAKQPSESILLSFLPRRALSRRIGVPYETYAAELQALEPAIRIVGLDTHVGFLVSRPDGFRFVHSSGSRPWCVVEEDESAARVLRASNYRVQGSITGNREVLRRWLEGEPIQVHRG